MGQETPTSEIVWLVSRGWTLTFSTIPDLEIRWTRTPSHPEELPQAVLSGRSGDLRSATLEACRMEFAGPVTQPQSPSGAEPSPAVPSSPVSASTSRQAS
jgi:hypothetical protein